MIIGKPFECFQGPGGGVSMELGPPSWEKMVQKLVNPWSV